MKKLVGTLTALILITSCGPKQFYERTETGLEYYFFEKNDGGKTGDKGDIYNLNITAMTRHDSVVFQERAMFQRSEPIYPGDFHEGLGMLREKDSAAFKLSVDSFFTLHNLSIPRGLENDSMFKLHIGVVAILNPFEHTIYKSEQELAQMKKFVERKAWTTQTDTTGIMYEIVKSNDQGELLEEGDSVALTYIYSTLDDRVIERTREGDAWSYKIGGQQTRVAGLDRLLTLMRNGEKARALIPFTEAFGEEGFGALIPPYTTLVIELSAEKEK
ncbi:MAG: FKBP-type peptidyl-prolyl cis-trans isomerase [Bacteroidia bacterium]|nr:FKBP-type peptidyl-prolyl cis-trans isomerase [Bacteroidia bacterium]